MNSGLKWWFFFITEHTSKCYILFMSEMLLNIILTFKVCVVVQG